MAEGSKQGKSDEAVDRERISIDNARDTLGDLVIRAGIKEERIIITRYGEDAAALVPMADLKRLESAA